MGVEYYREDQWSTFRRSIWREYRDVLRGPAALMLGVTAAFVFAWSFGWRGWWSIAAPAALCVAAGVLVAFHRPTGLPIWFVVTNDWQKRRWRRAVTRRNARQGLPPPGLTLDTYLLYWR